MKIISSEELNEELVSISFNKENIINSLHKNSNCPADWLAFPIEGEMNGQQQRQLQLYCEVKKIQNIFASAFHHKGKNKVFSEAPTATLFQKIQGEFALRAYTIVSVPNFFQIISDGDYYTVLIGALDLFSSVFEMDLEEGIKKIGADIENYSLPREERKYLSQVLDACKHFNKKV